MGENRSARARTASVRHKVFKPEYGLAEDTARAGLSGLAGKFAGLSNRSRYTNSIVAALIARAVAAVTSASSASTDTPKHIAIVPLGPFPEIGMGGAYAAADAGMPWLDENR